VLILSKISPLLLTAYVYVIHHSCRVNRNKNLCFNASLPCWLNLKFFLLCDRKFSCEIRQLLKSVTVCCRSGAVALDGRIEPGDMILEVNGVSFERMSNDDAVRTLREAVQRPGYHLI